MGQAQGAVPHKLVLSEGSVLTVTGVSEVAQFDETAVQLTTPLGSLWVQGEGLRLKTLLPDQGQLTVTGRVTGLQYEQPRPAGRWRRLLG